MTNSFKSKLRTIMADRGVSSMDVKIKYNVKKDQKRYTENIYLCSGDLNFRGIGIVSNVIAYYYTPNVQFITVEDIEAFDRDSKLSEILDMPTQLVSVKRKSTKKVENNLPMDFTPTVGMKIVNNNGVTCNIISVSAKQFKFKYEFFGSDFLNNEIRVARRCKYRGNWVYGSGYSTGYFKS